MMKFHKCKCGVNIPKFKRLCDTCQVSHEHELVREYFADKGRDLLYTKTAVFMLLLMIFSVGVYSQSVARDYVRDCVLVNDDYTISVPDYKNTTINWPNGTKEVTTSITGYHDVLVHRDKEVCNESVTISGKTVDFTLQDYNCKNITGEVICDSCIDGNCDGTCSSGGGETCCKIIGGTVTCKNSAVMWNESGFIAVRTLQ